MVQIREEVSFTKGRVIVRGKLVSRGKAKRADYILYFKPNIPIAIIEAKDNNRSVGDGLQQGLEYAATLDIPFVLSSNGDGFVFLSGRERCQEGSSRSPYFFDELDSADGRRGLPSSFRNSLCLRVAFWMSSSIRTSSA